MVSDITGIDYTLLEDNVILEIGELPISRKDEKLKKCDFILKIGQNRIINLELNRQSYIGMVIKNLSYLFHLFSSSSKSGEEYNDNLIVTQINLNCFKAIPSKIKDSLYTSLVCWKMVSISFFSLLCID